MQLFAVSAAKDMYKPFLPSMQAYLCQACRPTFAKHAGVPVFVVCWLYLCCLYCWAAGVPSLLLPGRQSYAPPAAWVGGVYESQPCMDSREPVSVTLRTQSCSVEAGQRFEQSEAVLQEALSIDQGQTCCALSHSRWQSGVSLAVTHVDLAISSCKPFRCPLRVRNTQR